MVQDSGDVEAGLGSLLPILKKQFAVKKIGIFGSTARGTSSPSSDIDILVEFEKGGATFDHYMELIFYLEDVFKKPVDLVTTGSISPYMKPEIDREVIWCEG